MSFELKNLHYRGFDPRKDAGNGGLPVLDISFVVRAKEPLAEQAKAVRADLDTTVQPAVSAWVSSDAVAKVERLRDDLAAAEAEAKKLASQEDDLRSQIEAALDAGHSVAPLERQLADVLRGGDTVQQRVTLLQKLTASAERAAALNLHAAVNAVVSQLRQRYESMRLEGVKELTQAAERIYAGLYGIEYAVTVLSNGELAAKHVADGLVAASLNQPAVQQKPRHVQPANSGSWGTPTLPSASDFPEVAV